MSFFTSQCYASRPKTASVYGGAGGSNTRISSSPIRFAARINAKIILDAKLAADDFKMKFQVEQSMRLSMEADIVGLRRVLDEMKSRMDLEGQYECLKDELIMLKRNHSEEVVCVDASPSQDLNAAMTKVREHYEMMIAMYMRVLDGEDESTRQAPIAQNLLKNPNGEEGLEFWELTQSEGSQWKVEDLPGHCGYEFPNNAATKFFVTSFEPCLKKQVIDLLAAGYTPEKLDSQPIVTVEDWYGGRTDCGCTYEITVCLLDENQKVLQEFKPDPVTLDPAWEGGCSWRPVIHIFSEYGPGLRFISFQHGGKDTKFWAGWYGVRVTGSLVTLKV